MTPNSVNMTLWQWNKSNKTYATSASALSLLDDEEHKRAKKWRYLHVALTAISSISAIVIALCFVVFVYLPNHRFLHKPKYNCVIIKADLACWQRNHLYRTRARDGQFTCWHFKVQYGQNATAITRYNTLEDFPDERDGCNSEASCGMEEWPCRVDRGRPTSVALRWSFPILESIVCLLFFTAFVVGAAIGCLGWLRGVKVKEERNVESFGSEGDGEEVMARSGFEGREENGVPFSFRKRMPTWMQYRGSGSYESGRDGSTLA